MAGTAIQDIKDFHDVIRLLEEHPEWRADLRRVLLTGDLLDLPHQIAGLTAQVADLVEAQRRTDTQIAELTGEVRALTGRVEELTTQMGELIRTVQKLSDEVGMLKGKGLETHYRQHGSPFFGVLLRRPHVLSLEELSDLLDPAIDQGTLSPAEALEVRRTDLVVRGTHREDGTVVYLVVEVSWSVDTEDVERAARRATRLAKTGLTVLPMVAGETMRSSAAELSRTLQVWQVTDAEVTPPTA